MKFSTLFCVISVIKVASPKYGMICALERIVKAINAPLTSAALRRRHEIGTARRHHLEHFFYAAVVRSDSCANLTTCARRISI
jgi:hypothetical protein